MRTTTITLLTISLLISTTKEQSSFTKLSQFSTNLAFKSPKTLETEERFNFFKTESSASGELTVTAGWKEYTPHIPTTPKLIIQKSKVTTATMGKELSPTTDQKIHKLSDLGISHIEDFIFFNENQLLVYYKAPTGTTPEYQISLFEINASTLDITKKDDVMPSQDANGLLNTLTNFNRKAGVGVLFCSETKTGFFFPSDDISSVVKFKYPIDSYAVSFNTFNSESKLAIVGAKEKFVVFDYTTVAADTEVSVTEYAIDTGFYVCDLDFNQKDKNRFLALTVKYDAKLAPTNSKLKYYDLKATSLDILGQVDMSSESFKDMTSARMSNIPESNYFLFGVTKIFSAEFEIKVFLTDVTEATKATTASPAALTYHEVTNELLGLIPLESIENPKIMSFRPIGDESSDFMFTITHGTIEKINDQDIGKNGYSFALYITLCHPTCLDCSEIAKNTKCTSCPSGAQLIKSSQSETTGICLDEETAKEVGELPKSTCGDNEIIGCIKCSGNRCSSCTTGSGIAGYNEDFSAGDYCVRCPVANCASCEMKSGDVNRTCSQCLESFSLMENNGTQVCQGAFWIFGVFYQVFGAVLVSLFF